MQNLLNKEKQGNIADAFEEWMRKEHLKECNQCQKEGRARLMDHKLYAVTTFRYFYETIFKLP